GRMKVAMLGAGAGGAAAAAELVAAGHEVRLWARSSATLAAFVEQGGVAYEGVLGEGLARPKLMTSELAQAVEAADVILVCLPAFAHDDASRALARVGTRVPVVLNPGQTGGALEVRHGFHALGVTPPGVARVMRALDEERRAVARAFGHDMPSLIAEMQAIGTVEASVRDLDDLVGAIAASQANRRIKAPASLAHRYYREDFGHGLLP